ncbi:MAG TPA: MoxR family ATPase [Gemmatimonadaceae bacterium]|nr:MoxR family ATPase [Gemmatimonadaceae bacterium]
MSISIQEGAAMLGRVRDAVSTRVIGQDAAVEEVLVAFLARGHALIEGVPGTAKTLLVRTVASAMRARFTRIQFTPDLMPADVTGVAIYRDPQRGFEFQAGPIFTDLLLADEINRAPAKTQAALLEAMSERQVTVDGKTRALDPLFMVLATQNPVEHEGTFPLPEAQLDRFLLKIVVSYPSLDAELQMLTLHEAGFDPDRGGAMTIIDPVLTADEARECRALVDTVRVAPEIREYIASITRATRSDPSLVLGASPRATVALLRAARAGAVLEGRDYVVPDDVKARALAVLRHRVVLAPELEVEGRGSDEVLSAVLTRAKVPS